MANKRIRVNRWTLKDTLDMLEAVFTIIVSLMAIWGTLIAWENGFWHKVKHIADHLHTEYQAKEIPAKNAAQHLVDEVKKQIK